MRKYFFEKKLEEGILIKRPGQTLPSVIVNGREEDAVCQMHGIFPKHMEYGISCLAGRSGTEGAYQIYAVSLDRSEVMKKRWICISTELIERAVGFFLEKHQMEELHADYQYIIRSSGLRPACADYSAGNLMIEIKCSFAGLKEACSNRKQGMGLVPDACQVLKFKNLLSDPEFKEKELPSS